MPRGGFQHWKELLLELGPFGYPASVGADARNGQCSWSVLALCSATGATGIPHLNSFHHCCIFSNTAMLALDLVFLWSLGSFTALLFPMEDTIAFGYPLPTPSVNHRNCNTEESWPCPAVNCTWQQAALPCFTPGSGRNKGLGSLGLTSLPLYTLVALPTVTTGLPVSAWIVDGNKTTAALRGNKTVHSEQFF